MGIDVERLEKELTATWAEATREKADGAGSGVTRACALNLVVYAPSADDRRQVDDLLDEVFERNPCRAIVLFADRESVEPGMEAYVSTRCAVSSKGAKQICGEQITIEVSGASVEAAASAVAPLLVSDVSVFLWWKDIPHYDDKLFGRLVEMADRVVIDSATFDRPHEDMKRLAALIAERGDDLALTDLNWGRLTTWRTLVASFWDAADHRPHLERLERVRIGYESPTVERSEIAPKALLALGWLASRLGWGVGPEAVPKFDGGGAEFKLTDPSGREIEVELRAAEESECGSGMLKSLTLTAGGEAEFFVELKSGGTKLETGTRVGAGERAVGRILSYEARSEGGRLSRELSILARDRVYEESVAFAARLLKTFGG